MMSDRALLMQAVQRHALAEDAEFRRFLSGDSGLTSPHTLDYIFATPEETHSPMLIFHRLRWGGQFVFATRHGREAETLASQYQKLGFVIERGPERIRRRMLGLPQVLFGPHVFFFVARKVQLLPPGEFNNRFTYDVSLERNCRGYVVAKQVPSVETIVERLRQRMPDQSARELEQHARRLAHTIFPVFLTREAGFLNTLQRDLPEDDRRRVPTVLAMEKGDDGLLRKLRLNWLRKTDQTMSHVEFACQAADLLHKVHHYAKIIHLDLRLDNLVITDDGVGFVDFGSAAGARERISASPLVKGLFSRLMRTSHIQRVLERMTETGQVTAKFITGARRRVDRAVDLFSLATQIDCPATNPYMRELVRYDGTSAEAREISHLASQILRPEDPERPIYNNTRDLLRGLEQIRQKLD